RLARIPTEELIVDAPKPAQVWVGPETSPELLFAPRIPLCADEAAGDPGGIRTQQECHELGCLPRRESALTHLILGTPVVALARGFGAGAKRLVVHPRGDEARRDSVDLDPPAGRKVLREPDHCRLGRRVGVVARQRRGPASA